MIKTEVKILILIFAYLCIMLHSVMPHHHHSELHHIENQCKTKCNKQESEEHKHSSHDYCHAFNNIKLYNKIKVKHNNLKPNFMFYKLYFDTQNQIKTSKNNIFIEQIFIYKPPPQLLKAMRAPPVFFI